MMRNWVIFAILLLSTSTLSTITPRSDLGTGSVLQNDIVFVDLTQNFNLDQSSYPITATGTNGITPYVYDQPYFLKNYTEGKSAYGALNFSKIISEDFVMFVYDQSTVIIQQINGEGKALADTFATQTFQQGTICTDATFYRESMRLFVGCYSQDTAYIYTIDPNTAEIQYTLTIPNPGIKNRLRMFITNFSKKASDPQYLVIYD